jgi:ATP-dependent Zn protease
MTQPPHSYANWQTIQPKKRRAGLFGWVLFIALAIMLFMLLNKTNTQYTQIPFSEFQSRLLDDKVKRVVLQGDEIVGEFRNPETVPYVTGGVTKFRTAVPTGMSADWSYLQWMLDHRGSAIIEVENNQNLLVNLIVPLVPWLLIFGFIWFFVFRQLRGMSNRPPQPVYLVPPPPGQQPINPPPPPISGGSTT